MPSVRGPLDRYTTLDTCPRSTAGTGTVTTVGNVFYTSAADQLEPGDWLWSEAGNSVRQVLSIRANTDGKQGKLATAFAADLSAVALKYVRKEDVDGVYEVALSAEEATEWNGLAILINTNRTFTAPEGQQTTGGRQMEPVVIDGAVGDTLAAISRF